MSGRNVIGFFLSSVLFKILARLMYLCDSIIYRNCMHIHRATFRFFLNIQIESKGIILQRGFFIKCFQDVFKDTKSGVVDFLSFCTDFRLQIAVLPILMQTVCQNHWQALAPHFYSEDNPDTQVVVSRLPWRQFIYQPRSANMMFNCCNCVVIWH